MCECQSNKINIIIIDDAAIEQLTYDIYYAERISPYISTFDEWNDLICVACKI